MALFGVEVESGRVVDTEKLANPVTSIAEVFNPPLANVAAKDGSDCDAFVQPTQRKWLRRGCRLPVHILTLNTCIPMSMSDQSPKRKNQTRRMARICNIERQKRT